jgi:hypothetical protein
MALRRGQLSEYHQGRHDLYHVRYRESDRGDEKWRRCGKHTDTHDQLSRLDAVGHGGNWQTGDPNNPPANAGITSANPYQMQIDWITVDTSS